MSIITIKRLSNWEGTSRGFYHKSCPVDLEPELDHAIRKTQRFVFYTLICVATFATGPKNPMITAQIKSLEIDVTNVAIFPSSAINWVTGEEQFPQTMRYEKHKLTINAEENNFGTAPARFKTRENKVHAVGPTQSMTTTTEPT